MDKKTIDLSRLLGFDSIADLGDRTVDFRDNDIAARLGAKMGEPSLRKDDETDRRPAA
jgi:hypothetical protein